MFSSVAVKLRWLLLLGLSSSLPGCLRPRDSEAAAALSTTIDPYDQAAVSAAEARAHGRWSLVVSENDATKWPAYTPATGSQEVSFFSVSYQADGQIDVTFKRSLFANQFTDRTQLSRDHASITVGDVDPYLPKGSQGAPAEAMAADSARLAEMLPWVDLLVASNPRASYLKTIFTAKVHQQVLRAAVFDLRKQMPAKAELSGLAKGSYVQAYAPAATDDLTHARGLFDLSISGEGRYRLAVYGEFGLSIAFAADSGQVWAFVHPFQSSALVKALAPAAANDLDQRAANDSQLFNQAIQLLRKRTEAAASTQGSEQALRPLREFLEKVTIALADVMAPTQWPLIQDPASLAAKAMEAKPSEARGEPAAGRDSGAADDGRESVEAPQRQETKSSGRR